MERKKVIACVCADRDLRMGRALEGREPQVGLGFGVWVWVFFPPSKKLKYFCGNGLCFDKPSFALSYKNNLHSEDFCPW